MSLQTLGQPGEVCPLGTLPAQTGGHHAGQHGDGLPNDWPQFAVLAPHGQPANWPCSPRLGRVHKAPSSHLHMNMQALIRTGACSNILGSL